MRIGLAAIVAVAAVLTVLVPGVDAGRTAEFVPLAADTASGDPTLRRKVYEGKSGAQCALPVTVRRPGRRNLNAEQVDAVAAYVASLKR